MSDPTHLLFIPGIYDPVSSLTHLAGAVFCAILSVSLVGRGRGDARRMVSLGVFAFSCVLLLSLSGVFHLLSPDTAARDVLKRLDHAAIFVLIAGSFTPIHVILFREGWQRHILAWIWAAAVACITVKSVYFDSIPDSLGLLMYLGLGWLGVISTVALALRFGLGFVLPLVWGALAYTLGALADHLGWPVLIPGVVGPHEIFHLAVLAGISFHWAFIRGIAFARVASSGAWVLNPQVAVLHVLVGGKVG